MKKSLKKTLGVVLSLSMIAGTIVLPAATASADVGQTWKFDFGATAADGWTQVTAEDAYTDAKGYGFLGQDDKVYDGVVDGYNQSVDKQTELKNGGTDSDAYHDYVYTEDDHMPIRFALKVQNNTYYKVKVTMGYSDKNSTIYLTSERRHFVLTDEKITAGNKIEKTFTAAVHSVQWKNRAAGTQPIYVDDMLNVCVHGENAMINAIEIEQVAKPKVVWIFGDSTTTDAASGVPWLGYNTYTGWGASVAKFLPENIAVVNLAEGGLAIDNQSYFNVGKDDMTAGDILMLPMGHNGTAPNASNLEYYYNAITSKGGTFVACAPIERLSNISTQQFVEVFQNFAKAKNCPFVSLYQISKDMYTSLGSNGQWYTHTAQWTGTASKYSADNDASHLNDFGSEIVTKGAFEALAAQVSTYPALADFVSAQASIPAVTIPKDMMTAKGTDDYKNDDTIIKPPHAGFPYPDPAIEYDNLVDITSAQTTTNGGKTYLTSYKTVRHSDLPYITAWAAAYDANGALAEVRMNRLEPMAAKTVEDVYLTLKTNNGATTEEPCDPLEIPEGGSYKTFVWYGAFSDNSMTYEPYSDVFSGYDTTTAAGAWTGVTPDETDGSVTIAADGKGVYALTTPATSGKVMFDLDYTAGGNATIVISPAADGSTAAGSMSFSLNSTTGVLSRSVLNAQGKTETVEVIDSLKKDITKNVKFIYDIDHGKLEINMDGVGIAHVDYPEAVTTKGITPAQIASIAISGAAKVENMAAYTVATDALPQKTLTITYDGGKGVVSQDPLDVVLTSVTATKNSKLQLTATATPVEGHNYVFGGWYTDANHTTLYSKDATLDYYLVDDATIYPYFYEQAGLTGVADYTITAKSGENDVKLLKQPEASADITLDITDIVDRAGNPTAAFDHTAPNVTWALKNNLTGVSISGNTLTVTSAANIPIEESTNLVVTATCNGVSKDYTIILHNFTDLVYHEDYEDGANKIGEQVPKWVSAIEGRYLPLYNAEASGNVYLDMDYVTTENNNGTTLTGTLLDSAVNGVTLIQADIAIRKNRDSNDPSMQFVDGSGKIVLQITRPRYTAPTVNGKLFLKDTTDDPEWVVMTALLNDVTKTADVKIVSRDHADTTYYDGTLPYVNSEADGFQKMIFATGKTMADGKVDNVFVDHIAEKTAVPEISADKTELEFNTMNSSKDVILTIPDGYVLTGAVSSDTSIATATIDAATKKVTVTSVAEGDATVTATVTKDGNPYIKRSIDITAGVKKMDNADLKALSVKTNEKGELVPSFAKNTVTYTGYMANTVTTLTVTPELDNSQATYKIKYNNVEQSGGTITVDSSAETQKVEVVVTAADETTTKTYTVNIDNSFYFYNDFEGSEAADLTTANGWSGSTTFMKLETSDDYGQYLYVKDTRNNKLVNARLDFPALSIAVPYVYEMDVALGAGNKVAESDPGGFFAILTSDSAVGDIFNVTNNKYLFNMTSKTATSRNTTAVDWFVDGSETADKTVNLAQSGAGAANWTHVKLEVNPATKAVKATLSQGGTVVKSVDTTATGESAIPTGFAIHLNTDWPTMHIDNIKIYPAPTPTE